MAEAYRTLGHSTDVVAMRSLYLQGFAAFREGL
jgi:hypothetical protein